jgi:hypothetical protein
MEDYLIIVIIIVITVSYYKLTVPDQTNTFDHPGLYPTVQIVPWYLMVEPMA